MIFVSDLDRTLIFSKRTIKEDLNNFICIERTQSKEISYMTKNSVKLINEIISNMVFVPCTMRMYEQVKRIDFLNDKKIKYMITNNGAKIYVDEIEDMEWTNIIESMIDKDKVINTSEALLNKLGEKYRVIRYNDLYIEIKAVEGKIKPIEIKSIVENYVDGDFKIEINSNKLYIIPHKINKGIALQYLKEKYLKSEQIITAGDSQIDLSFLSIGDIAIVPKHKTFERTFQYTTSKEGIFAGEEILLKLNELLCG